MVLVPWRGLGSRGAWSVAAQIRRQKNPEKCTDFSSVATLKVYTGPRRVPEGTGGEGREFPWPQGTVPRTDRSIPSAAAPPAWAPGIGAAGQRGYSGATSGL